MCDDDAEYSAYRSQEVRASNDSHLYWLLALASLWLLFHFSQRTSSECINFPCVINCHCLVLVSEEQQKNEKGQGAFVTSSFVTTVFLPCIFVNINQKTKKKKKMGKGWEQNCQLCMSTFTAFHYAHTQSVPGRVELRCSEQPHYAQHAFFSPMNSMQLYADIKNFSHHPLTCSTHWT